MRDTVRHDEVVVEQARHGIPASRREAEAAQQDSKLAAFPQGSTTEPAQLAADLKKVAERFETNTNGRDKDSATSHPDTVAMKVDQAKTDQKAAAPQSQATPPKANAEPPKASAGQNDKSPQAHTG